MKRESRRYYWETLGISSTKDIKEIKKAYSKKLREIDIENDIESFNNLKDAFDFAREYASSKKKNKIEDFIKRDSDNDDIKIEEKQNKTNRSHPYIVDSQDMKFENEDIQTEYIEAESVFKKARYLSQNDMDLEISHLDTCGHIKNESYIDRAVNKYKIKNDSLEIEQEYNYLLSKLLFNNDMTILKNYLINLNSRDFDIQVSQVEKLITFMVESNLFINFFDMEELYNYINDYELEIDIGIHSNLVDVLNDEYMFSCFSDVDRDFNELVEIYSLKRNILECSRRKQVLTKMKGYIDELDRITNNPSEIAFFRRMREFLIEDDMEVLDYIILTRESLFKFPENNSLLLLYLFSSFLFDFELDIRDNSLILKSKGEEIAISIDVEKMNYTLLPYRYYYIAYIYYELGNKNKAKELWEKEYDVLDFLWDDKILDIVATEGIKIHKNIEYEVVEQSNHRLNSIVLKLVVVILVGFILFIFYRLYQGDAFDSFKFFGIVISIYLLRILYSVFKE